MVCVSSVQAAQTHQYRLDGSLSDDFAGPALLSNGGTLGASGYSFGANQGLTLGASLGSVYTIDLGYRFDTHSGYQKIIDFSNLVSDTGMYTIGGNYQFYPQAVMGAAPGDGVDGRLTLTRDATNTVRVYSNGVLSGSFLDSSGIANFGSNSANFFIDDTATSQGEAAGGFVDYIRTWDTALNATDVAGLGSPVAAPIPEPETYAMMLAGLGLLGVVARRRKQKQAA
jgi:hypothetical protein